MGKVLVAMEAPALAVCVALGSKVTLSMMYVYIFPNGGSILLVHPVVGTVPLLGRWYVKVGKCGSGWNI